MKNNFVQGLQGWSIVLIMNDIPNFMHAGEILIVDSNSFIKLRTYPTNPAQLMRFPPVEMPVQGCP